MKIVVDLQSLQTKSRERGIGRYSLAMARAMIAEGRRHEWFVILNHAFPDTIDKVCESLAGLLPRENIRLFKVPTPVAGCDSANRWRCWTAELIREQFLQELQPDWVHISSLFEGLRDDAVTSVGALSDLPTAVTLYDLTPYFYPEHYLVNPTDEASYMRKVAYLRKAELLLAISEFSRQDAIDALGISGDRVVNVSADADASFRVIDLDQATRNRLTAQYRLHREFAMYTCSLDYHKNMERLIEAYAQLADEVRSTHQLVIVCNLREEGSRLSELAAGMGLRPDELVFTGYVSDEDLVALYNMCKVFVFPSLREGFGLPVLEAMRCGAPVIGSNLTSVPEVIGLEEALFDPLSIDSIKEKLFQVLTDDDFRQRLRRHGSVQAQKFSWQASARKALAALEAAQEQRQANMARLSSVSIGELNGHPVRLMEQIINISQCLTDLSEHLTGLTEQMVTQQEELAAMRRTQESQTDQLAEMLLQNKQHEQERNAACRAQQEELAVLHRTQESLTQERNAACRALEDALAAERLQREILAREILAREIGELRASHSWRLTGPLRFVSRTTGYMVHGAVAWLTFAPSSRPRRMLRAMVVRVGKWTRRHPRYGDKLNNSFRRFPALHRRLKSAIRGSIPIEKPDFSVPKLADMPPQVRHIYSILKEKQSITH